jgi:hypothetical protein
MEAGSSLGTVVLVHGGFVDGSGWQGPGYDLPYAEGLSCKAPQPHGPRVYVPAGVLVSA